MIWCSRIFWRGRFAPWRISWATAWRRAASRYLAGLLNTQVNWVLSAHRRAGLVLERRLVDGAWSILTLRKPG